MIAKQFWSPSGDNSGGGSGGQGSGAGAAGQGDLPERGWMGDLPEPLRGSTTLRKFSDESWKENLAKSYVELEGKLGKAVSVPGTDATAEEWGKFFSRIGRPEKPEDYEVPQGKVDQSFEQVFRKKAHESGLTKAQAKVLLESIVGESETKASAARAQAERDAADAAKVLRAEFGDKYDDRIRAAQVAAKALFPDGVRDAMARSGILSNPDFIRSMSEYGERFGETQFVGGKPASGGNKADPYDWMKSKYGNKG